MLLGFFFVKATGGVVGESEIHQIHTSNITATKLLRDFSAGENDLVSNNVTSMLCSQRSQTDKRIPERPPLRRNLHYRIVGMQMASNANASYVHTTHDFHQVLDLLSPISSVKQNYRISLPHISAQLQRQSSSPSLRKDLKKSTILPYHSPKKEINSVD
jgi:hypothetical protein